MNNFDPVQFFNSEKFSKELEEIKGRASSILLINPDLLNKVKTETIKAFIDLVCGVLIDKFTQSMDLIVFPVGQIDGYVKTNRNQMQKIHQLEYFIKNRIEKEIQTKLESRSIEISIYNRNFGRNIHQPNIQAILNVKVQIPQNLSDYLIAIGVTTLYNNTSTSKAAIDKILNYAITSSLKSVAGDYIEKVIKSKYIIPAISESSKIIEEHAPKLPPEFLINFKNLIPFYKTESL